MGERLVRRLFSQAWNTNIEEVETGVVKRMPIVLLRLLARIGEVERKKPVDSYIKQIEQAGNLQNLHSNATCNNRKAKYEREIHCCTSRQQETRIH
jgi:hypothetical protein